MAAFSLAVDARDLTHDHRGIGRYARAVLRRLALRDDIELTLLTTGFFPSRRRAGLAAAIGSQRFAVASRIPKGADLVWHPANRTVFSRQGVPNVVTIHDVVPFRYPNPDLKRREHEQLPFLRSAREAQSIIAVSQFGKSEICEVLQIARERIAAIYHGVDGSFTPGEPTPIPQALADREYLLFVGDPQAEPRKNFALLYEAYRTAWPAFDGPALAIVCATDPDRRGVVHLPLITEDARNTQNESLRGLYRGTLALCVASYHETFGMPMIEAMACGAPVLASDASCLPEIGGDAAIYAPPHSVAGWTSELRRIAGEAELRARCRSAGIARAAKYDWDATARAHAALFREVADAE